MTTKQQATPEVKRGRGRPKDAINKGGRPKADKKGALLWVSAEFVDAMTAYLELLKQQHTQRQAKQ